MAFSNKQNTFRNEQIENIKRLKAINLKSNEAKACFDLLRRKNILNFQKQPLTSIQTTFAKEKITSLLEETLFSDMKVLLSHHETNMKKLNEILLHEKIIQNEYQNMLSSIKNNEVQINELIDFYSDYLKDNKGFLIRNEILSTFLDKVLISKEEKENLANQEQFDETFFMLINKMNSMKDNIDVIQKNSASFSKTLLMSIKEHFSLIDEMLNEKIVIYLKHQFRSKTTFTLKEYKDIILLLTYLHNKDQYIKFVLNEYTQMRKKFIEEQLRSKYFKISNKDYDEIYKNLNEDFILYFEKEFILINYFYDSENNILLQDEQIKEGEHPKEIAINTIIDSNDIFYLLNLSNVDDDLEKNKALIEKIMNKLGETICKTKDFSTYVVNINSILYVFEDLFFQHTQKTSNYYEIYKITLLSYYYTEKIEELLKEKNLEKISLTLSIIISNYKKSYSLLFKKYSNESLKTLQKLKSNIINYLTDSQVLLTNESVINQTINNLIDDYIKIFDLYKKYPIKNDDKEIANPLQHEIYIFLMGFFNTSQIKNETQIDILFKVINLVNILNSSLESYDSISTEKNKIYLNELIDRSVNLIMTNVLSLTKFEEEIKKNLTHEQMSQLIEHLLEKIQLSLMNQNFIKSFSVKEEIKQKIKQQILELYKKEINPNNSHIEGITEDEIKNYLDIL